ncbi:MAG: hypothetical protein GY756_23330 [bacterium]|nr:hypothetical protein [bacterium]
MSKIQVKYLKNIFFLIVLFFACIRLENYFHETDDCFNNPILVNNELLISEQIKEEYVLTDYKDNHEAISCDPVETIEKLSYSFAIISYNKLIVSRFKTMNSNHIFHNDIISILQKNNIWHQSIEEELHIS